MIVAIGMTTALGVWLDRKLGTSFITVIMFFLGAAGGCQGVYRMVKQIFKDEDGNPKTYQNIDELKAQAKIFRYKIKELREIVKSGD